MKTVLKKSGDVLVVSGGIILAMTILYALSLLLS